ncbi:hypothetical protein [Nocardia callitridis]|uniref:Uncharacterized protein n=1 Tax=Nocardia callitridis TaxID=648753 RepID=A0ABP9KKZ7_9NOCA
MYVEKFQSAGDLTAEIAEDLAALSGRYSSRITVSSNGRSVQSTVLPVYWDVLRVVAGSAISVTAEGGHQPRDEEDRRALRDFVLRFQTLTGHYPARAQHTAHPRRQSSKKARLSSIGTKRVTR